MRAEAFTAAALDDERSVPAQLSTGLLKIGLAIRHQARTGGEEAGLSATQGQILVLLLHREDRITRLADIARELAITEATASVALRPLVAKGLVEKARAASDARALDIRLTEEGIGLARRSLTWTDFLLDAAREIDEGEQAVFQRSVIKMIRAMQEKGLIPVSRMCVSCTFFRPNVHAGAPLPHHCAFVDAPFGDRELRIDCADFEAAPATTANALWTAFNNRPARRQGQSPPNSAIEAEE